MIDMSVLYFVAPLRKKSRIGLAQQLPRLRTAKSSQELSSFKANLRNYGWLSELSGHQYMHPFQVIGHGHQLPFTRGRVQTS